MTDATEHPDDGSEELLRRALLDASAIRDPEAQLFLAMVEYRLGHKSEAKTYFTTATEMFSKYGPQGNSFNAMFKDWIIVLHLRDEATNVLGSVSETPQR